MLVEGGEFHSASLLEIAGRACYFADMEQRKVIESEPDPAQKIYPDMPNHFSTDAAFCAAVDIGIAQIEAGQAIPIEKVVANLRRKTLGQA